MTVVFCTYHSLGIVERAQDEGAPPFDVILCDEAHRTTGVERPGDKTSRSCSSTTGSGSGPPGAST